MEIKCTLLAGTAQSPPLAPATLFAFYPAHVYGVVQT